MGDTNDPDRNSARLVFWREADGSGRLVFGDSPAASTAPDAVVTGHAQLPGLAAHGPLRYATRLSASAAMPALAVASGALQWDANTRRTTMAQARSHYQPARPVASATRAQWRLAERMAAAMGTHWQLALPLGAPVSATWRRSQPLQPAAASRYQIALALAGLSHASYQHGLPLRAAATGRYQRALPIAVQALSAYQHMLALRPGARGHYQLAQPLGRWLGARFRAAVPLGLGRASRYQIATWLQAGMHPPLQPPGPEPRPPCYDPATLGRLVFTDPWTPDGRLVFVCTRPGGVDPELPPATIVVIRRRSYIVLTDLEVLRADTGQPLPALVDGFHMRLDRQSWTWDFSVNLHAAALPLLQPGADGLPRELEVRVNGQPFRMLAESRRRSTQHPRSVLRVGGRGKAALLDAPFADVRSFTQPAARTAQQLMLDALTINGVSIGWTVDWGLTDWPVPADTWAHHGTWISAINDIAASVGAYVQPHDTDPVLRILPGYPVRSWQLASATPDIELPPGIATVEEVEWVTKPAYDAIYMHGEPGNAVYYRKRAGTPGTSPAPDAVHALLVHPDAAAQRAIAELSDTGRQVPQTLTMPVLPETGIIKPGLLLRYTDDADVVRTGIVRGVSVSSGPARIEQTIEVQAHE